MSVDHPSVQQAFHVLKDHLEAIERLQGQLKRWVLVIAVGVHPQYACIAQVRLCSALSGLQGCPGRSHHDRQRPRHDDCVNSHGVLIFDGGCRWQMASINYFTAPVVPLGRGSG